VANHLVIVLGAGASLDCAVVGNDTYRPPLTRDLFDRRFDPILIRYPLAQRAASDIRVVVGSGAEAIEAFLRERLRHSKDPYAQARYREVPLYLHELMLEVSRNYTRHPRTTIG
jgi:hypothetical protein